MSQNQSYFWQTTRHNVYLKRSAKMQMLFALMAVIAFSTICVAEENHALNEDNTFTGTLATLSPNDGHQPNPDMINGNKLDELPKDETNKETKTPKSSGFVDAFTASISVILLTELGDKTFFIAAIMAMRHPRLIVFTGAIGALALMTVLSVGFGIAATIIPKAYTYYISTALFAVFGLKMIYEGYVMKPTDAQEELEEVQSDLRKREDELMRSKRGKYEDSGSSSDGKRKNSNSDKEDSGAGAAGVSSKANAVTNPEMQHRQRKQLNHNNKSTTNGCELNNIVDDDDDSIGQCHETDVFLEGGGHHNHRKHDIIKMSTFHNSNSSPALSNQTTQTNCDDEFSPNNNNNNNNSSDRNFKASTIKENNDTPQSILHKKQRNKSTLAINTDNGSMTMIHHTSSAASSVNMNMNGNVTNLGSKASSINSASNLSIKSAGANSASAGLDGSSKRRLERSATANVVQDPESGMLRKNTKKGAGYLTARVFMQAFTMTFLAEWGDRSQLTTIILAASKNVYGVITGGIIGHSICTGLAVIGGRIVAAKISVRTVTIVGGIVFLCFALYALIVRPDDI